MAVTPRAWTLAAIMAAILRRRRVLIIAFLALSAGAVAAVLTARPVYEGGFKLLVKRDRADAVVSGVAGAQTSRPEELSESELNSQVELLKAQDLRERVVREAGLIDRVREGAANEEDAIARALKQFDRDLQVTPIRKTWLIDVTYRDKDPKVARKVLDLTLQSYFEKHLTLHRPSGTFEFFSEQVDRARQEVEAAQAELLRFAETAGVVSAATEQQAVLQQLAEFDAMRRQAAAALAEASQRQRAAAAELSRVPEQRVAQRRVMQNPGAVEDIQSRILTLEMKRTELLQRFTPDYRGVVEIEQQLRDARAALTNALDTTISEETVADNPTRQWLDTEVVRARTDDAALRARVAALSGAVAGYRSQAERLERQSAEEKDLMLKLAAAEDRYRLYLAKQEEARISDELDKTRIANVAVAQAPSLNHEAVRQPSLAMLPLLILVSLILSGALALAVDLYATGFSFAVSSGVAPAPAPAALSVTDDARLAALARTAAASSATFSSRLTELQKLTDSISEQWTRPVPQPRRHDDDNRGWTPMPADGLRQGA
jgi:uncharacterized protein involved in exopolysaccharide biosynthesis